VDDLPLAAVEELGKEGVDLNNPDTIKDLGMIPKSWDELKEEGKSFGEELGSFTEFEDVKEQLRSIKEDPLTFLQEGGELGVNRKANFETGPGYGEKTGTGVFGGVKAGSGQGDMAEPGLKASGGATAGGSTVGGSAAVTSEGTRVEEYGAVGGDTALDDSHQGNSGGASTATPQEPEPAFAIVTTEGSTACDNRKTVLKRRLERELATLERIQADANKYEEDSEDHDRFVTVRDLQGTKVETVKRELDALPC
jgi:hypothetical protein